MAVLLVWVVTFPLVNCSAGRSIDSGWSKEPPVHTATATTPLPDGGETDAPVETASRVSQPSPELETLPLDALEPASVSLPKNGLVGAPVLVVAHGAGGSPEWHCRHWAALTQWRGVVLCLAGRRVNSYASEAASYYYPDHHALGREIAAALIASVKKYPGLDASRATFAGYSQGATMGALALVEHSFRFTRAVFVEGGFAEWNSHQARLFHEHGGERVLFVCGRKACAIDAQGSARWLRQSGVDVQVEFASGAGHTLEGAVAEKTEAGLGWIFEGDPRWRPLEDAQR